ncbi:MAG: hypothetical protein WDN04_05010 [Rhodospirillales bacterium]
MVFAGFRWFQPEDGAAAGGAAEDRGAVERAGGVGDQAGHWLVAVVGGAGNAERVQNGFLPGVAFAARGELEDCSGAELAAVGGGAVEHAVGVDEEAGGGEAAVGAVLEAVEDGGLPGVAGGCWWRQAKTAPAPVAPPLVVTP